MSQSYNGRKTMTKKKKVKLVDIEGLDNLVQSYTLQNFGQRAIAEKLGVGRKVVRTVQKRLCITSGHQLQPSESTFAVDERGNQSVVESRKGNRITTLDALVLAADIDLETWEIYRHVINKWEVGARDESGKIVVEPLWQVKAWLQKRTVKLEIEQLKKDLLTFIEAHSPKYTPRKHLTFKRGWDRHLLEIGCYDLHLGQRAWAEETGNDYDLEIASAAFSWAIEQLAQKASKYQIERVCFPVGQDFFHMDDDSSATPRSGNQLDVDTRWLKLMRAGTQLIVDAVDRLLTIAPVDIIIVPGNHDKHSTFSLGEILSAWYRQCNDVTIHNSAKTRKYYAYGKVLLGFTHGMGRKEKPADLSRIMPVEEPQLWSASIWREMHVGHIHHRVVHNDLEEFNGIVVRYLPTLCGTDAWHYEEGYVGNIRAAEAYIWNHDAGLSSIETANLPLEARE